MPLYSNTTIFLIRYSIDRSRILPPTALFCKELQWHLVYYYKFFHPIEGQIEAKVMSFLEKKSVKGENLVVLASYWHCTDLRLYVVAHFNAMLVKKFLNHFFLHVPWVFYLAFVDVRSADTHLQPNLYHTLGGKTFHLFWLKVPVPQGRPAPLCSETAWPISQKNEWVDDFFLHFCDFFANRYLF